MSNDCFEYVAPYELRKAHQWDAGYDLYWSGEAGDNAPGSRYAPPGSFIVYPGEIAKIPTGVRVSIPRGWAGIIKERSGYPARGIHLSIRGGVIDSGYTGEIIVLAENTGDGVIRLLQNKAIAQLVLVPVWDGNINWSKSTDDLGEHDRGANGFGSSDQGAT